MEILFWFIIFVVSLVALVKGAKWFLEGAENVGISFGLSPFVIGVLIVGIGTSLPELASAIAAVMKGASEIVVANAVGSNIANILLVVGLSAIVGRKLIVDKDLIDIELPLLAISTILFLGVIYDGVVVFWEALLLSFVYIVYLFYALLGEDNAGISSIVEDKEKSLEIEKKELERKTFNIFFLKLVRSLDDIFFLVVGAVILTIGAKYLIDSVIELSKLLNIATSLISITAIAFGTSLPELVVSLKAVSSGKTSLAIGNILGSNAFNALMVVGIPGLFTSLTIDNATLTIGIPIMALATLLFIISGISRKIHHWEGMMFLLLYLFFIVKLFGY